MRADLLGQGLASGKDREPNLSQGAAGSWRPGCNGLEAGDARETMMEASPGELHSETRSWRPMCDGLKYGVARETTVEAGPAGTAL